MTQPDELHSLLNRVRQRWRTELQLRTIGRAASVASVPLLAVFTLSRLATLRDGALTMLMIAACAIAVGAAVLMARRARHCPSDKQMARFIEERVAALDDVPQLGDALVSAVEGGGASDRGFQALVRDGAAERLRGVTPSRIVTSGRLRRATAEALAGGALLAVSSILSWPAIGRTAGTVRSALFPPSITVEVVPGDTKVAAGQPLKIRASVRADGQPQTRITPELTVTDGADTRTVAMVGTTAEGDSFQFSFDSVDRTFRYHVTAGSARSSDYTVTALFTPRVKRIDLRYEYPDFSGLAPRDEQDGGDIFAPAGTRVRVRVHTDKPISSGQIAFAESSTLQLRRTEGTVLEGAVVLAKDDSYRVHLADDEGLRSKGDTEYFIRLMDDRPPDVRIVRPAGDQQITPLEEVAIEARADDDYGISALELVYSVAGAPAKVIPFARMSGSPGSPGSNVTRVGAHLLAAEDLRVRPGDVISYYARARDVGRGKRSSETRSDMFFLEVRPFSEEFVAAQSSAMSGATGEQMEGLITAQKEIINATWNLERRAAAGRSAEDIKAVAQAQAELKARAEELVSRAGRGRSPFQPPLQVVPPRQGRAVRQGPDPVGAAIAAMGRAIVQLDGQRTDVALPHEMAALQGLLQAQAEIRRREVMQQQSGTSSGGMGRQGQDLSALFDKELQRQQSTNYESRSQVEERPDRRTADGSALDRIRDLARRQEELSRRQRQLADAGLSADERTRQLERLTREQAELRAQLEKLAKESQQGQAAGQTSSGQDGRGEMREATEQMRNAESQLARQDPTTAARNAARAAEMLRRLEQQVHGDSPEARQRAAGELRLEAQQIADEQRRIGAEAGRIEKGDASASADAWRRLAGEKDRLADRVDDLKRGAEQLAGAGDTDPQRTGRSTQSPGAAEQNKAGATAAARELTEQRIAERMRDTATSMRDKRAGAAETEEQIARALDRVADRLGGAGTEERSLSDQLEETRGIRDRLDRLERQIRDAEAQQKGGRQGRDGARGGGQGTDLQRLREQYTKELQRARDTLGRLERSTPNAGQGGSTPEQQEPSAADPGTQAFKQDFTGWASLRKEVNTALERRETAVSAQIARKSLEDRLSAGGSDRVPDAYRALIARYFEALAKKKR